MRAGLIQPLYMHYNKQFITILTCKRKATDRAFAITIIMMTCLSLNYSKPPPKKISAFSSNCVKSSFWLLYRYSTKKHDWHFDSQSKQALLINSV